MGRNRKEITFSPERDRIQALIRVLERYLGTFVSNSSPVPILLEILIDLTEDLKLDLATETLSPLENPEILFLELSPPDELGNTKSIKKFNPRKTWYDPDSVKYLNSIISFFILLKQGKTAVAAFAAALSDLVSESMLASIEAEAQDKIEESRSKVVKELRKIQAETVKLGFSKKNPEMNSDQRKKFRNYKTFAAKKAWQQRQVNKRHRNKQSKSRKM